MLAKDVKRMAADASVPAEVRAIAKLLSERYLYPVDFQVIDAKGQLYAQAQANDHQVHYRSELERGLLPVNGTR